MTTPFTILLNTSKTMAVHTPLTVLTREPLFEQEARQLAAHIQTLTPEELAKKMHISKALSEKTYELWQSWGQKGTPYGVALDTFVGDIYKGLRAKEFSVDDRHYADQVLFIVSGLYGLIRPLDAIQPYRLEMMYNLPPQGFKSLYDYWGNKLGLRLKDTGTIVNLASEEYFKVIRPYVDPKHVIAPQFLTKMTTDHDSTFVAVHAKVARGAFAQWLILTRQQEDIRYEHFTAFGYQYDPGISTPNQPTFVRVGDMKTM